MVDCTLETPTPPKSFIRRYDDSSTDACLDIAATWLKNCIKDHKECKPACSDSLPTRILDIEGNCIRLCEPQAQQAPYVALSHCWGNLATITTKLSTLSARKEGISWESLSKTFQDAVIVTRKLGYRYLWIDSLYIIQDSQADWENESDKMSSVFKNSHLTIASSRSADGAGGCFSKLSKTSYIWHYDLKKQVTIGTPLPYPSFRKVDSPDIWKPYAISVDVSVGSRFRRSMNYQNGCYWMSLEYGLPLFKRGWLLQERVLSPRVLHFGYMELYWECSQRMRCECLDADEDKREFVTRNRETSARGFYSSLRHDSWFNRKGYKWQMLVEEYSRLQLTREMDRLPALSGLAHSQTGDYLAGIWYENQP